MIHDDGESLQKRVSPVQIPRIGHRELGMYGAHRPVNDFQRPITEEICSNANSALRDAVSTMTRMRRVHDASRERSSLESLTLTIVDVHIVRVRISVVYLFTHFQQRVFGRDGEHRLIVQEGASFGNELQIKLPGSARCTQYDASHM